MPRRYQIELQDPETATTLTAFADATDRQALIHDLFEGERAVKGWIVTSIRDRRRQVDVDLPISEYTQRQVLDGVAGATETLRTALASYIQRNAVRIIQEGIKTIYG